MRKFNNFKTMYFTQGFEPSTLGGISILDQRWGGQSLFSSDDEANLGLVVGFSPSSSQFSDKNCFITDNGYIFSGLQSYNVSQEHDLTTSSTATEYSDIDIDPSDKLIYTTARYLGNYDGSWNTQWKDLGAEERFWSRQIEIMEDRVLVANGNYIASYSGDGSDFDANYKQLPKDYLIRGMSYNDDLAVAAHKPKGGTVNAAGKGAIFFWNGWSNGWNNSIYRQEMIDTITTYKSGWVFTAGTYLYYTNGDSVETLSQLPGTDKFGDLNIHPNGIITAGDNIFIASNGGWLTKYKSGIWVYNVPNDYWVYTNTPGAEWEDTIAGGLYFETGLGVVYAGAKDNTNSKYYMGGCSDGIPSEGWIIFPPIALEGEKGINRIEIDFAPTFNANAYNSKENRSINLTLSVSDLSRPFWGSGQTGSASSNKNEINYDDDSFNTINHLQVGDEILILEGSNSGERAFVNSISGAGTTSATATLSKSLSNLTENAVDFNIFPVQKAPGSDTIYTGGGTAIFTPRFKGAQLLMSLYVNNDYYSSIIITGVRIYEG